MDNLTIVEVAKWMEEIGIDFISQDGNFVTYGYSNEDGEVVEDTEMI